MQKVGTDHSEVEGERDGREDRAGKEQTCRAPTFT